jgi:hypothetical protein
VYLCYLLRHAQFLSGQTLTYQEMTMATIRLTASSRSLAGALAILAAIVLPVNVHADKITFPFKIDENTKLPILTLKIGDNTIMAMADTGTNNRIIFGKDAAGALKLPDQGDTSATGFGTVKGKKTTVPDGTIVGAEGKADVVSIKGAGVFLPEVNPPFGAIVGAPFLRTDDKNGAFLLNSATGKATIYDKAQAEKLTALPFNTPATAVASGSLVVPDGGTTLSATVDIINGTTSASASFILSTGVSDTLISSTVAAALGTLTPGPSESVTTELGTITVPTALLSVDVFPQQDPTTLNIGILPDSLNPNNVNVLGMDFLGAYPVLLLNAATSTISAVPEPATWFLWTAGLLAVIGCCCRNRAEAVIPASA